MLEHGLYKKLIPQFDCIYYLALFLHSYFTILSIQIVDSLPDERICFYVPALVAWRSEAEPHFPVTEAPHNIEYVRVSGEETFYFFEANYYQSGE